MAESASAAVPESVPESKPSSHRVLVAVLLTLAVIIGFLAILSTWVKRQALDTNNWVTTSTRLLDDRKIQNALGAYMVDQLFTNVDVEGELRSALPPQTQSLAGPVAAGLRGLADRAAPELLARPRVQDAWRTANRAAHKQLLAVLNGGTNVVSTNNGVVTLDLHNLVTQLAGQVGVEQQVAGVQAKLGDKLPPTAGQLVILRSKQLKTAQNITKAIRHLSIVFTLVSLALFALAVWLARGRRRLALRTTGWCLFGLGVATLLMRRVIGNRVIDPLVKTTSVKPAAHDAWSIATSLLYDLGAAFLIYGLLVVAMAWLAGPSRPATRVRLFLAPSLRDRGLLVYGVAACVYLLVLLWGPTPAFRQLVPILLIAALLVFGIEVLRRQTAREFPNARTGGASPAGT